MLKPYRTVQDVLSSPWAQMQRVKRSPQQTDRVLRSTKLEDSIYRDLRMEDTGMDEIENSAGEKLHSFPALSRDIFQSFYSLMPRRNDEAALSAAGHQGIEGLEYVLRQCGKGFQLFPRALLDFVHGGVLSAQVMIDIILQLG